jgi:SIR2-like protein/HD domain-containing protein
MKVPLRLVNLIAARQLVPFVGAGFSMPSLLPGWRDLMRATVNHLVPEKATLLESVADEGTLIDVAELLDNFIVPSGPVLEFFAVQFDNPRTHPNSYHDALLDLDFDTIVTTNWDRLIEKRLEHSQIPNTVIYRDAEVPRYNPSRSVQILKIHGTITDPTSLVYRKSQYESYWHERPLLSSLLSVLAASRGFLFLGYGFGDPNFLGFMERLKVTLGRNRQEHFALTYANPTLDARLKGLGVTVVPVEGFDPSKENYQQSTIETLRTIRESSMAEASDNMTRARLINAELTRLIAERPPGGILRMRGALGWLSTPPPDLDDPIYGSHERDVEERQMTVLVESFARAVPGAKIRCILHLKAKPLVSEYQPRHIARRMLQLVAAIESLEEHIEIVHEDMPSQLNLMLFDDRASLQGFRLPREPGIRAVRLVRDARAVARDIQQFDTDYATILEDNRALAAEAGIDTTLPDWSRLYIIRQLKEEVNALLQVSTTSDTQMALAVVQAVTAHTTGGQHREDGATPFAVHPVRVVGRLLQAGIEDRSILAAAVLHDIVEDCGVSLEAIESGYGGRVRMLVEANTRMPGESNDQFLKRLSTAPQDARIIKLADRLDNVWELREWDLDRFGGVSREEYLLESTHMLAACHQANALLGAALAKEIEMARNRIVLRQDDRPT